MATTKMRAFAKPFGKLHKLFDNPDIEDDKFFAPSVVYVSRLLKSLNGDINNAGEKFSVEIQSIDNGRPWALCGREEDLNCILIFGGLLARITEIAFWLSSLFIQTRFHSSVKWTSDKPPGMDYLFASDQDSHLESMLLSPTEVLDKRFIPMICFLTNYLLLFILLHEVHHLVGGHLSYFSKVHNKLYLAESQTDIFNSHERTLRIRCELHADLVALRKIVSFFSDGSEPFIISEINDQQFRHSNFVEKAQAGEASGLLAEERLALVWTGILMLANCWAISEPFTGGRGTHPYALDRFVNLYWGLGHISPENMTKPIVVQARELVADLGMKAALRLEANLLLGIPSVEAAQERYFRLRRRHLGPTGIASVNDSMQSMAFNRIEDVAGPWNPFAAPPSRGGRKPTSGRTSVTTS